MFKDTLEKIKHWIDKRFPLMTLWRHHFTEYYAPKNLNFWYFFGALAILMLVNQLLSGVWLTMNYTPTEKEGFDSVEHTMRYVDFGWLIRYLHAVGASAFFIVIYLHIYRCFLYGSYRKPRELLWLFGVLLYVLLMAAAYTGYVLPWGQMSYWASRVITSIIMAIPIIGEPFAIWFMGDYSVSGVTLHRFFSYHVAAIPMMIVIVVLFHLTALRKSGSNNPDGIEIKEKTNEHGIPLDGIPFHPYYTVKDFVAVVGFLFVFLLVVFYFPTMGGYFLESQNFSPADYLKTPEHIAPAWYLAPYYAMLRAVPDKLSGILLMIAAMLILFFVPWLDRSPVKSMRYKGSLSRLALILFTLSFIGLGYIGTHPVSDFAVWLSRIFVLIYFLFFLLMPIYTRVEHTLAVPERIKV